MHIKQILIGCKLEIYYRPDTILTISSQVFESMNTLRLMRAVPGCTSVAERCDPQGCGKVEQRMEQLPRRAGATLCVYGFLFRNTPQIFLKNQ